MKATLAALFIGSAAAQFQLGGGAMNSYLPLMMMGNGNMGYTMKKTLPFMMGGTDPMQGLMMAEMLDESGSTDVEDLLLMGQLNAPGGASNSLIPFMMMGDDGLYTAKKFLPFMEGGMETLGPLGPLVMNAHSGDKLDMKTYMTLTNDNLMSSPFGAQFAIDRGYIQAEDLAYQAMFNPTGAIASNAALPALMAGATIDRTTMMLMQDPAIMQQPMGTLLLSNMDPALLNSQLPIMAAYDPTIIQNGMVTGLASGRIGRQEALISTNPQFMQSSFAPHYLSQRMGYNNFQSAIPTFNQISPGFQGNPGLVNTIVQGPNSFGYGINAAGLMAGIPNYGLAGF